MSYGYSGYQSTPGGDSNSEYSKLSNAIGSKVQEISRNVTLMQKMVNQLGTPSDSESLRQQLHDTQHYTNQLARDTNNQLKELSQVSQLSSLSEQKQRRMLRERLTNEFSEALKNFQVIQRTAAQKEKESVIRARANSGYQGGPFDEDISSRNKNLIDLQSPTQQQLQQQQQLQLEEECNIDALREREQAIRKIEGDIVEVNQIFKDLATMVHEQGEVIDSIEANVESTAMRVESGTQQVAKARDYQSRARRKMFCLLVLLAIAALVIGIIIYVSIKN